MMNPQKKRDLDRRMLVAPSMLDLLRRADGLDLLDLNEGLTEVSETLPFNDPQPPYSTFVGLGVLRTNDSAGLARNFLVVEDVHYPTPGWRSWNQWRFINELPCADDTGCLFPANCVCFQSPVTGADGRLLPG